MDKRTQLFWSGLEMKPWPVMEQDTTKADFMNVLGHARNEDGVYNPKLFR
jgi:hypothetical protein